MNRSLFAVAALAWLVADGALASQTPHPAVCRIVVDERDGTAFGSGTLIDRRDGYGLVVTNWHVVRDAAGKIEVRFPDGFHSEARPVKLDETWDLAALVIWAPGVDPTPLAPTAPRPGEPLTICGYGQGDYRAVTGRCSDYYSPEIGMPLELVELDVEARQGDSGGPIFNARGELAGVLFGAGRGTTLGSFGGRVHSFLATLAPDIGAKAPTRVAQTPAGPRALLGAPTVPTELERLAATAQAAPAEPIAIAAKSPEAPRPRIALRGLRAKPLAAKPALTPTAAHTTEPTGPTPPAPTPAPSPMPAFATTLSQPAPIDQTQQGLDLGSDGRTMLAVFGMAALVVVAVRRGG